MNMKRKSLESIVASQRDLLNSLIHEKMIADALLEAERNKTRELSHRVDVLISIINNMLLTYGNY